MPVQNHPLPKSCAKTENQNDICRAAGLQDQSMRNRSIVQEPEEGGADCKGALEDPWLKILNNKKSKAINLETLEIPKSHKITRFLEESQDIDATTEVVLFRIFLLYSDFRFMAFSQECFHTQRLEPLTERTSEGPFTHASKETKPCGGPKDTDCHVGEWHEWTSCSAVCGKGRHTRMRCLEWTWGVGFSAMMQCVFFPGCVSGHFRSIYSYMMLRVLFTCAWILVFIYILVYIFLHV